MKTLGLFLLKVVNTALTATALFMFYVAFDNIF